MRKLALAASLAAVLASPAVLAQTAAPAAPPSDHTFTGNMTIASDYRFRGISQTFKGPTIQGGVDYSHSSGFYLGNWNSNVSGLTYSNGNGAEMDFYGGWKKTWGDWGIDVGNLYYYYDSARWNGANQGGPANSASGKYNNDEIYLAGSWKFLTLKYSYAVTDYFGLNSAQARGLQSKDCFSGANCTGGRAGFLSGLNENRGSSKGTGYIELNASYEVAPKWTLSGHIGHVQVKNYGELNYTDAKVGIAYDLSGWVIGAAIVGTNANKQWYSGQRTIAGAAGTRDLGTTTGVLSLSKTF